MKPVRFILVVTAIGWSNYAYGQADTIPPVVQLNGDTIVCIEQGEKYMDAGCMVSDNFSSSSEMPIIMEGDFITKMDKLGCWSLRYIAFDRESNKGYSKWRRIIIRPKGDTTPCVYSVEECKRLSALGIKDQKMPFPDAYIYPNPATSKATIYFKDKDMKAFNVYLLDIAGRVIRQFDKPADEIEINTTELLPGYYLVVIGSDKGSKVLQLNVVK